MSRILATSGISNAELKWRLMRKEVFREKCEICEKENTRVFYDRGAHYVCSDWCLLLCLRNMRREELVQEDLVL